MPALHHPNPDFTGTVTLAGHRVQFEDGTGHTDRGVPAFARAGYKVTPTIESGEGNYTDLDSLTIAALRDVAKVEDVDLTGLSLKADIVNAIAAGVPSVTPDPIVTDGDDD